jgi:hypothetical protein
MKKYSMGRLIIIVICLTGLSNLTLAQSVYKIEETKDVDMKLRGTSTLHKWEMDSKTVEGEAHFGFKPGSENELLSLKSLYFAMEVKDLKSDSKGLDKNAYKALKSDDYKDIHYILKSAIVSPDKDGKYLLTTHGKLTIAGVTKEIAMDISCVINKDGTITCTGSDKLNMSDYQVKPPSFMLGAMKTGDAITLDFVVVYKKQKGA